MKLGELSPFTQGVLVILLGALFFGLGALFIAAGIKGLRRYPGHSMKQIIVGAAICLTALISIYFLWY